MPLSLRSNSPLTYFRPCLFISRTMWFQLREGGSKLAQITLFIVPKHIYLDTNHTSAKYSIGSNNF